MATNLLGSDYLSGVSNLVSGIIEDLPVGLENVVTREEILDFSSVYDLWEFHLEDNVSDTSNAVDSVSSLVSGGRTLTQTGGDRPDFSSRKYISYNGSNEFLQVSGLGLYNTLHDGTGGTIIVACRIENSDQYYGIAATAVSSVTTGFGLVSDDRSAASKSGTIQALVLEGTSPAPLSQWTADGELPVGSDGVVAFRYDSPSVADVIVDGDSETSWTEDNTPVVSDHTANLRLGCGSNSSNLDAFHMNGRQYVVGIFSSDLTDSEIADFNTYAQSIIRYSNS